MLFRTFFMAALCLALARTPLAAQTRPGHTLDGVVRDTTGAVMVGVDVTLAPLNGGESLAFVTDASGHFEFHGLPSESYRVTASAMGFAEAAAGINFVSQPNVSVELVMHVVITEHVEVSTDVAALTSGGLGATTLSGVALDALPDDPGALLQRVRELAGATGDTGQIEITVDGFNGAFRVPPKSAIQAIRISSNWFAPEFAEPGQARIDILTKPGATAVHGDLHASFNNEAMNARNALAARHPSGHMRDVTGYLSGPLVPGRLSFVFYAGQWSQRQNQVINATALNSAYLPVSVVDTVPVPSRVDNVWFGTTYQVAPLHTLALSFSRTSERASNLGLESGLDLAERAYRRTATDTVVRAALTSVPSPRVLNELRVQVNPQQSTVSAETSTPAVIVFDAFSGGGNQDALFTATRHLDVHAADTATLFAPRHTLKAGASVRTAARRYTDTTNFGGVFAFGARVDADGTLISPLENYRRTLLGLPGYAPSQFWMTRGNPDVRFRDTSVAAFAQDDWTPRPRITLTYGLRTDWQSAASRAGLGGRAGLAVALDGARKNVARIGAGTFYQPIEPELTLDVTRLDGRRQEQLLIDRPSFFPAVPSDLAVSTLLPTVYLAADDLGAPQIFMSAVTFDRELTPAMFGTLKYGYQHGTHLLRSRDVNSADASGVRADPRFGRMLQYESTGRLRRQELTAGWRWNTGAAGSLFANYSFVHGRSDTDGRGTLPADAVLLEHEFGAAAADRTHSTNLGAHVTLPGSISVSPYLVVMSGRVFNITTGFDNNADGVFTDRPAVVPADTPGAIATPYGFLLADHSAGAEIVARNAGRDPAAVRLDLRLSRAFRYTTAASFVVAAGIENLLNRANFEGVNGVITSPSFGLPKRAGSPRHVNLSAGFSF